MTSLIWNSDLMGNAWRSLNELPLPGRFAAFGALALGLAGALAGLVGGLFAYPPTAWFAVGEVGVPAALVGALLGFAVGSVAYVLRSVRDMRARSTATGRQVR